MAGLAKGVFFGATAFLVNLFCKNMNFMRVVLLFLLFILWQWAALNFMLFQANPKFVSWFAYCQYFRVLLVLVNILVVLKKLD